MIDRAEIVAARDEHLGAIVADVETVGAAAALQMLPDALGVDDEALFGVAFDWGVMTSRTITEPDAAAAEGFVSGFLVAVRLLGARAGA